MNNVNNQTGPLWFANGYGGEVPLPGIESGGSQVQTPVGCPANPPRSGFPDAAEVLTNLRGSNAAGGFRLVEAWLKCSLPLVVPRPAEYPP